LAIGKNSLASGDCNVVIGDGVGIYGNNVVSIFTSGSFPTINLFDNDAVYLGNYSTSSVIFGVNGLGISWENEIVKFKINNKTAEIPLN
jgi:hypothetical protein